MTTNREQQDLISLTGSLARIKNSTTSDAQYQQALSRFQGIHSSASSCWGQSGYLDITTDRLEMTPAAPVGDDTFAFLNCELAEMLDRKVNGLLKTDISNDSILLSHMAANMSLFKQLMDLFDEDGKNDFCAAYPVFTEMKSC